MLVALASSIAPARRARARECGGACSRTVRRCARPLVRARRVARCLPSSGSYYSFFLFPRAPAGIACPLHASPSLLCARACHRVRRARCCLVARRRRPPRLSFVRVFSAPSRPSCAALAACLCACAGVRVCGRALALAAASGGGAKAAWRVLLHVLASTLVRRASVVCGRTCARCVVDQPCPRQAVRVAERRTPVPSSRCGLVAARAGALLGCFSGSSPAVAAFCRNVAARTSVLFHASRRPPRRAAAPCGASRRAARRAARRVARGASRRVAPRGGCGRSMGACAAAAMVVREGHAACAAARVALGLACAHAARVLRPWLGWPAAAPCVCVGGRWSGRRAG